MMLCWAVVEHAIVTTAAKQPQCCLLCSRFYKRPCPLACSSRFCASLDKVLVRILALISYDGVLC